MSAATLCPEPDLGFGLDCNACMHEPPDDVDPEYEGARADTCPVCGAPGGGCVACLAGLRCDP